MIEICKKIDFLLEIELTEENLTIFEQAVFALGEYYSKTQLYY